MSYSDAFKDFFSKNIIEAEEDLPENPAPAGQEKPKFPTRSGKTPSEQAAFDLGKALGKKVKTSEGGLQHSAEFLNKALESVPENDRRHFHSGYVIEKNKGQGRPSLGIPKLSHQGFDLYNRFYKALHAPSAKKEDLQNLHKEIQRHVYKTPEHDLKSYDPSKEDHIRNMAMNMFHFGTHGAHNREFDIRNWSPETEKAQVQQSKRGAGGVRTVSGMGSEEMPGIFDLTKDKRSQDPAAAAERSEEPQLKQFPWTSMSRKEWASIPPEEKQKLFKQFKMALHSFGGPAISREGKYSPEKAAKTFDVEPEEAIKLLQRTGSLLTKRSAGKDTQSKGAVFIPPNPGNRQAFLSALIHGLSKFNKEQKKWEPRFSEEPGISTAELSKLTSKLQEKPLPPSERAQLPKDIPGAKGERTPEGGLSSQTTAGRRLLGTLKAFEKFLPFYTNVPGVQAKIMQKRSDWNKPPEAAAPAETPKPEAPTAPQKPIVPAGHSEYQGIQYQGEPDVDFENAVDSLKDLSDKYGGVPGPGASLPDVIKWKKSTSLFKDKTGKDPMDVFGPKTPEAPKPEEQGLAPQESRSLIGTILGESRSLVSKYFGIIDAIGNLGD